MSSFTIDLKVQRPKDIPLDKVKLPHLNKCFEVFIILVCKYLYQLHVYIRTALIVLGLSLLLFFFLMFSFSFFGLAHCLFDFLLVTRSWRSNKLSNTRYKHGFHKIKSLRKRSIYFAYIYWATLSACLNKLPRFDNFLVKFF